VSPTISRAAGYRFYFFSREETRMHVHHQMGEAKIWIEPDVMVAENYGLSERRLATALRLTRERQDEIRAAWTAHFRR
jgi:hypothetical protein